MLILTIELLFPVAGVVAAVALLLGVLTTVEDLALEAVEVEVEEEVWVGAAECLIFILSEDEFENDELEEVDEVGEAGNDMEDPPLAVIAVLTAAAAVAVAGVTCPELSDLLPLAAGLLEESIASVACWELVVAIEKWRDKRY